MANTDRQKMIEILGKKKSLIQQRTAYNPDVEALKENFAKKSIDAKVNGYAISTGEILDILASGNEIPAGIQICFGFQKRLNNQNIVEISSDRLELILTPIFSKPSEKRKYWTTCILDGSPTDVPCPPYVTDCKKGK